MTELQQEESKTERTFLISLQKPLNNMFTKKKKRHVMFSKEHHCTGHNHQIILPTILNSAKNLQGDKSKSVTMHPYSNLQQKLQEILNMQCMSDLGFIKTDYS